MVTEIIGIDHIYIAVRDLGLSEAFYDQVMPELGFRKNTFSINDAPHIQYYNRYFGYVLRPAGQNTPAHNPYQSGLHHLCFRVESIEDVNKVAQALNTLGIQHTNPKIYPAYAEDYYAIYFEDPDGIRLEITNFRRERKERAFHWNDDPKNIEI